MVAGGSPRLTGNVALRYSVHFEEMRLRICYKATAAANNASPPGSGVGGMDAVQCPASPYGAYAWQTIQPLI